MDVKEAVKKAKSYLEDMFTDTPLLNLALEEVELDEREEFWNITLGFSRPFSNGGLAALAQIDRRYYKTVKVRDLD